MAWDVDLWRDSRLINAEVNQCRFRLVFFRMIVRKTDVFWSGIRVADVIFDILVAQIRQGTCFLSSTLHCARSTASHKQSSLCIAKNFVDGSVKTYDKYSLF